MNRIKEKIIFRNRKFFVLILDLNTTITIFLLPPCHCMTQMYQQRNCSPHKMTKKCFNLSECLALDIDESLTGDFWLTIAVYFPVRFTNTIINNEFNNETSILQYILMIIHLIITIEIYLYYE